MEVWTSIYFENKHYSLAHLQPFTFSCPTASGVVRRVDVTFRNHCFTRSIDLTNDDPLLEYPKEKGRIFCSERYELSKHLPGIVLNLPKWRIYQTWAERNYTFVARVDTPSGAPYHLFFSGKRVQLSKRVKYVQISVESAYPYDNSPYVPPYDVGARRPPNEISFKSFVESVFMERPIRFDRR